MDPTKKGAASTLNLVVVLTMSLLRREQTTRVVVANSQNLDAVRMTSLQLVETRWKAVDVIPLRMVAVQTSSHHRQDLTARVVHATHMSLVAALMESASLEVPAKRVAHARTLSLVAVTTEEHRLKASTTWDVVAPLVSTDAVPMETAQQRETISWVVVTRSFLRHHLRFAGCPKSEAQKETLW